MRRHLLAIVILSLTLGLQAQMLKFDVMKGNKNLGYMHIDRTVLGQVEEINITSKVTYKLLLSFRINVTHYEKFVNGKLNWGKALSTLNGRTQKDSKIVANKEGHLLTLDGVSAQVTDPINFSIAQIYFYEPVDGQEVFSQQFARFLTFKEVEPHKYVLASPDGDNYYSYTNGICTEVRVQRDFANFNFVMQPESMQAVQAKADSLYVRAKKLD